MKHNSTPFSCKGIIKKLRIFSFVFAAILLANFNSFAQTVVVNPSTPWTVPAGVTSITVICYGAGGGSGGIKNVSGDQGSGGGGGGATAISTLSVSAGQQYTVTIGAGGSAGTTAGTNGGPGNPTIFSGAAGTVTALGGGGGFGVTVRNTVGAGGTGAAAGTGGFGGGNGSSGAENATNEIGGAGGGGAGNNGTGGNGTAGNAATPTNAVGGTAGAGNPASAPYQGAAGRGATSTTGTLAGIVGVAPGGGASGAASYQGSAAGAIGGAGQVVIIYTVSAPPSISGISPNPVCEGATETISGTNLASVSSVTVNGVTLASLGGTFTASAGFITFVVPSGTPSGVVGVINPSGSASSAASLTVNAAPAVPSISSTPGSAVCQNTGGQTYSVTDAGLTYAWIVSGAGWSPTTGSGVSFTTTSGTATGTISVTGSNANCTSAPASTNTNIIAIPAQPSAISPSTAVCAFSTQNYSVTNVAGVTYTWTVPASWTINSGNGTNTINVTVGNAGGTITVTPSNSCGNNGTAQTLSPTVNAATLTVANPIPATGYILSGTNSKTVFGFTITPNACVSSYDFTAASIQTGGTAGTGDMSNFELVYDANANGIYDAGDVIVSGAGIALANPLNFTVTGQTGITTARNYIVVADIATAAVSGHTFNANLPAGFVTAAGGNVSGGAVGNVQTIEGALNITAVQPAAGTLLQNTTNNLIAEYQVINNGGTLTPTSFVFATAGTYTAVTDFTNFQLWQSTNSVFNTLTATPIKTITAAGNPQTLTFNTGFTALAATTTYYFFITTDLPTTGINGDYVNIAADALTNFTFNATVVRSGTSPATVGNAQTIQGALVTITKAHPAAGTINQNTTANPIAAYQMAVSNFAVTPTSFTFTTAGSYNNATDIVNYTLYQNSSNTIAEATMIGNIAGTTRPQSLTFNSGFTSLPVGNVYFIITADVGSCAANGNTINIAAGTANFANFSFTAGGNYVTKTGPTNPVPAGNVQTIIAPLVTIASSHPLASTLSQNSTNNIIASYLMTAGSTNTIPSSFTFTTGGTYTAGTDFVNFQLWVNDNNNLGAATLIGSATAPISGGSINFSSFPAAATIAAGTSSYFLITADVPLSGINGDYVNIAADALSNLSFTSPSGGCVSKTGSMTASNNQTISGPTVAISTVQPAVGTIAAGSTNNIIAVYQLDVSNAASITPTNLMLTSAGTYVATDMSNFKLYQNSAVTLSGATLAQTVASPGTGGNITFNSGFTPVSSAITSYLIITADVAATPVLGHTVNFTSSAFSNISFTSSTGGGVQKTGTNPAAASNSQTIVGPTVAISAVHPAPGSMLVGSINNLVASYKLVVTGASVTPSTVSLTTGGSYAGASDITNFYLYQNTSNSLSGATLVGTVAATGTVSGQLITFGSGFSNIAAGTTSYLLLSADVNGGATPPNTLSISSATATGNFAFATSATITGGTLGASNNQIIAAKLDVYWSGANNWDNSTIDWGNTSGPYNTSVWIVGGNAHLEGTAGRITTNAAVIAKQILNPSINGYTIDAGANANTITLTSPANISIGSGITYAGDANNRALFAGINGLSKLGAGELQLETPFVSGFTGDIKDNAGILTFGSKTEGAAKYPYNYLKNANSIYLNNANLTFAADAGADASLQNLTSVVAAGTNTISLYQNYYGGYYDGFGGNWMNFAPTTGTGSFSTTATPLTVGGQLTVDNGGYNNSDGTGVSSTFGYEGSAYYQNSISFGGTTYTANTTFVGYANQANLGTDAGTMININLGGYGNYLVGIGTYGGGVSTGAIADNGYSTTFYGGGGSVYDGAQLLFNSASSSMTGNWIVGDAAGTNAGWLITNTTTCLTRGTVTVNNYSKLCPQLGSSANVNITYAPTVINLTGLGPANQEFPSALDFYNFSGTAGITSLPSNIVLNPVDATHRLASIGSMVGSLSGTTIIGTTFQLNGALSGTGGLEKTGPGVIVLNAQNISGFVNSYQDSTRVREGTLTVNYGSNLGTGALVMYQLSTASTILNLNNTNQTINSLTSQWTDATGTASQTINLNGCTLYDNQSATTTYGNGARTTLTALIAGTGNFIKMGSGTLTLSGPNTYTGMTQVKAGILVLGRTGGTTLPATNTVDILGGILSITTAQTLKNVTLSSGTLNIASGVTLTITGAFTLVNGNITGGGTLAYSNGTLIYGGSAAQTVNSGNNPVEWPAASVPTNVTFDNFTYTGLTTGGVSLIAGKTIAGTATVNGWLDFAGNSITGAGAFTLNGLTSKSYTGVPNGTNFITGMSSINGIYPGMVVTGTGVPAGTYIIYIDTVLKAQTLYLNNAVAGSGTVAFTISTRGGVKISMPSGLGNGTATSHVQVTGTKTYNAGANYVFNKPISGTQIYPGFPTTPATATYSPAWDVKINVGTMTTTNNYNITMAASGVGSSIEVADTLMLATGVLATNKGLVTWDNPGLSYLSVPQASWGANNTAYTNSFIATCDNTGTPISVAGPTTPFTASAGFKIKNVANNDTYFPVGASFTPAFAGQLPSPNRMMINNNFSGGTPEDFTVVVNYGDILYTPGSSGTYRVNRVWYVKTSASPTDSGSATMKLFFTRRDNSAANWVWPAAGGENEVEAGFDYSQPALIEKDYSGITDNFTRISSTSTSDIPSFLSAAAYPLNTEIYGQYTIGVSHALDNTKNGIGTFNRFSIVNPTGIVLPVTVINFKAYQQGSGVQTSWTAMKEINIDDYEVERSTDAINFVEIGSVAALDNGKASINYGFYDSHPMQGNNYYRVKVIGKDGSITYTNIAVVVIGGGISSINIFPNPVTNNRFVLQMNNISGGKYALLIYNTLGQQILEQEIEHAGGSASQTIQLPAGTASGDYHLKLTGTGMEINKMILVQ